MLSTWDIFFAASSKRFYFCARRLFLWMKIIFVDEKGRSSILDLSYDKSDNRFTVRRGWRAFCCRNGHKTGCFLMLTLVRNGKTPVLRIFPLEKDESSIGKFNTLILLLYVVRNAMFMRNPFLSRKELEEDQARSRT